MHITFSVSSPWHTVASPSNLRGQAEPLFFLANTIASSENLSKQTTFLVAWWSSNRCQCWILCQVGGNRLRKRSFYVNRSIDVYLIFPSSPAVPAAQESQGASVTSSLLRAFTTAFLATLEFWMRGHELMVRGCRQTTESRPANILTKIHTNKHYGKSKSFCLNFKWSVS